MLLVAVTVSTADSLIPMTISPSPFSTSILVDAMDLRMSMTPSPVLIVTLPAVLPAVAPILPLADIVSCPLSTNVPT